MRQIQFYYDQPANVSEPMYLQIIENMADGLDSEAGMLAGDQLHLMPNFTWVVTPEMIDSHQKLIRGIDEIDDATLREMFLVCQKQIDLLWQLEYQLIQIVSTTIQLAIPQTKSERRKWHRKMKYYYLRRPWKDHEDCQQLVKQSQEAYTSVKALVPQIKQRLEQLRSQLSPEQIAEQVPVGIQPIPKTPRQALIRPRNWNPADNLPPRSDEVHIEPFDQPEKDLIDEAREESDAREAIKLLRRALMRVQDNGQKFIIYMELGLRHEELGNVGWAIRYYTDSLKVIEQPLVLFWRGRLYYRQRKFTEAKADLSAALTAGLPSPEREEAEQYRQAIIL
jgi:tetratricopeptide (TPR) repeat protein